MFLKLQYQISSNASERKLLARNVTASDVLGSIRGGNTRVLGEQGDGIVLSSRQPITYDYVTVDRKLFESIAGQGFFDGICRTVERFELDYIFKNAMIRGNGFENPDVKDLIRFINGFNKLAGQGSVSSSTQVHLSCESSMFHEGNSLSALMQRLKQKIPSAEFVRI